MISVIIPTYNGERYIGETLRSVFDQTFRDYEVIVVDDGSTDGTRAAIEPYLARLRYLQQPNAGISAARNRGAALAAGELLAFLDHDDRWDAAFLERGVAFLGSHPGTGVVATAVRVIAGDGTPTARIVRKRSPGERYTTRSLLEGDVGTIHGPLIRRQAFLDAGGYDPSISGTDDCDLWLTLSFHTEMRHLAEPLLHWRWHAANTSKNRLENARQWLRILEKFEARHPDFTREHRALVRRNWAKQLRRLGRELLAHAPGDARARGEARSALTRSIRLAPLWPRTYLYAALCCLPGAGTAYGRLRRLELDLRERLRTRADPRWKPPRSAS